MKLSEQREAMHVDRDVPIRGADGIVLRADVFRPVASGQSPILLTYGPKGMAFHDGDPGAWNRTVEQHPDRLLLPIIPEETP